MTNFALTAKERLVLQTLHPVLQSVGIDDPDMRQIYVGKDSIREFSQYDELTEAVLDHDMPAITGPVELDHYTTSRGFRGILDSQALHLAPVTRRLNEGELGPFALEHGLHGYVDPQGKQTALLRAAAADIFYAAFHQGNPSDRLWDAFGDKGNGYRLRFRVTASGIADLRAVRYQGAPTLLRQVNDALSSAGLPRFVMKGVSRVGAYFIPAFWQDEQETRLLAKRFLGGGAPVVAAVPWDYWPAPINAVSEIAKIELLEIGVRKLDPAIVRSRLPAWSASTPVVLDVIPPVSPAL